MSINKITPLDTFVSNDAPICYGILKPGDHYEGGIPVIKVKNIIGGVILEDDLLKTTPEIHAQYKRAEVKEGDILLTIRGTTGRVAIVPNSLNGANITQDTARIRVSSNDDSLYIFYALQSFNVQQQITLNTVGQAVKGINIAEVKKLKIYHPILDEQKAIAQILSTWDQAISATEKLLENSQQQKKALMQQLLTGKKRLLDESGAQFDGEWKLVKVSNLLKVRKERQVPTAEVPLFSLTIENGITPKSDRYNREFLVKNTEEKKYKVVRPKDIVYNPANLRWGAINFSRLNHSVVVSPIYEVLYVSEKDKVSLEFIAQKLMTKDQINRFAAMVEGTLVERMAVKIEPFLATKLSIPPSLKEQQAIAIVLSKADQQIELLQKKLDCLKQEKKALMQQLLTGKKRVKVAA
ncbi:restriction endonuclease subunit S [Acinetobacter sp. CFCC 11171]|uniref:restriction endonuclease subunit S n=1 Tax=Acinetobacter sp. CFCC 11171 TaxID=1775558 RepID=UPI001BC88A34|nr:restriction endonuclease subunit S [Acinetobacter sp. CFCC 11171]